MNIQEMLKSGTISQVQANISNVDSIMKQTRAMQAEANRTANPNEIERNWDGSANVTFDMGQLSYVTEESMIADWERENGFYAMLDSLDYNNMSTGDLRRLVTAATVRIQSSDTFVFGAANRRNLGEMASFIEEQLENIESNPDISEERRSLERNIWEEAFVNALSWYQHNQRAAAGDGSVFISDRETAESNMQNSINFALGVIQNVESISSNGNIQSLITRGMEELIELDTHSISQAHFKFSLLNRENVDVAREARETIRNGMTDMFNSLREQMERGERTFPLVRSFDASA